MMLSRYPLFQYAYFVNDVEEAVHKWNRLFHAGPFVIVPHHKTDRFDYRGTDQEADVSYAFGYLGDDMIQFIQQHDETPSIYRDMYKPGEYGFHHIGLLVSNVSDEIKRFNEAGYETACTLWGGDYVAYMDCRQDMGCYVELHGDAPLIRDLFDGWKRTHEEWDGVTDLIREA